MSKSKRSVLSVLSAKAKSASSLGEREVFGGGGGKLLFCRGDLDLLVKTIFDKKNSNDDGGGEGGTS